MSAAPKSTLALPGMDLRRLRTIDRGGLVLAVLSLVAALVWAFPVLWAAAATVLPTSQTDGYASGLAAYVRIFTETEIGRWYLNSLVTSGGVTVVVLFISAACGYALSQTRFHGARPLWWLILASFMIPAQALIIAHFFLMHSFGFINTWLGVILPQLIVPVAVIIYKQFFDQLPREFREAAMVDGAGHWRILFSIYLPMNWGVTAALAIITFIGAWNAFLWPFLAVTREPMMNISVGIGSLYTLLGGGYLAASILAGLPVAIVYLIFQRRVTQAIVLSAGIR